MATHRKRRRGAGEGSIWHNQTTGYWHAAIELGYAPGGARKRWTAKARTKTRLLEKIAAARLEIAQTGTVVKRERRRAPLTVGEWLRTWLYDIQKPRLRPQAWAKQRSRVERWAIPAFDTIALTDLSTDDVRTLLLSIREQGKTPTSKSLHRHLVAALNVAVAEGKVTRNVAALVGLSRSDASREDHLAIDEARAILRVVRTDSTVKLRDRVLTELRLVLGARPQELLGLEPARAFDLLGNDPHVDLTWQLQSQPFRHGCDADDPCGKRRPGWCPQRAFDVPSDYVVRPVAGAWCLVQMKTDRSRRRLPIPRSTTAALAELVMSTQATGLVFTADDGGVRLDRDDLAEWRRICALAGIERTVDRYIGRHTAASLMAELGTVDPETQRDLMGHTTISTTNGYKHRSRSMLRAAVNDMEAALTAEQPEALSA